jgi:7,8-dihydro-6-hydroxymethylpterin-pyrophosphokinase
MSKTAGASDLPVTAGAPIVDVEVMSTAAHGPGNQPLVPNLATAERAFAERMLEALDKYQAQASERYRNDRSTPRRLDLDL